MLFFFLFSRSYHHHKTQIRLTPSKVEEIIMSPKKTKKCVYALIFEKCIIYVYIFGRFSSLFFSFIGHNDIIAYNSLCSKSVILFFFIIHFMLFFLVHSHIPILLNLLQFFSLFCETLIKIVLTMKNQRGESKRPRRDTLFSGELNEKFYLTSRSLSLLVVLFTSTQ